MVQRTDAPIVVQGAEHFVERNYREGGQFQWVRETAVNAIEAGATKIEFGTEWQGVAERGVYRRLIADNGSGMTPDELLTFFRTYGGSGRPIGGIHENFGIGSKCSLFPWNRTGVVVVSWHPDYDEPSMIWVRMDPSTGTYGLRTWGTPEGGENVIAAGPDDELGLDWSLVKPSSIEDHGTVLVLLGNEPDEDTVLGDPNRNEGGVPGVGIVNYLNRRMWDLGDIEMRVDEYRRLEKVYWPKSVARSVNSELQLGSRKIEGAKYYIDYPPAKIGGIADSGTVTLSDRTELDWFLWQGQGRDGIRNASGTGYLAARYAPPDNRTYPELFDVVDHQARFRSFGISEQDVRRRLWLVARPPLAEEHGAGVYMSSDRNRLLTRGGPRAGDPLPWDEWALEFANKLPTPIVAEIDRVRAGSVDADLDDSWRERLAERFGRRWRQLRLMLDRAGDRTTEAEASGGKPRTTHRPHRATHRSRTSNGEGGRDGRQIVGRAKNGTEPASVRRAAVGLPKVDWKEPEEFPAGIFAMWNPPSPANPDGLVQLNTGHPIFKEELLFWASQYATHLEDDVKEVIQKVYAQMIAANIAHGEALKAHLNSTEQLDKMRSPEALTASLLGLVGASAMIGTALGGALGRRREPTEAESASA